MCGRIIYPHTAMHLVNRGRLSVQRVEAKAWETIHLLADNGGWEEMNLSRKSKPTTKASSSKATTKVVRGVESKTKAVDGQGGEFLLNSLSGEGTDDGEALKDTKWTGSSGVHTRKRKIAGSNDTNPTILRRSNRRKIAN